MSRPDTGIAARRRQTTEAYRTIFALPMGQIVLRDLIERGGVLAVSHVPGLPDDTAFRDGRKSIVLELLTTLRFSAAELIALSQEPINPAEADEPTTDDAALLDDGDGED